MHETLQTVKIIHRERSIQTKSWNKNLVYQWDCCCSQQVQVVMIVTLRDNNFKMVTTLS